MTTLDVLFVLPSLAQGGAERVMINHAEGLHRAGDRVRIVLTDGRPGGKDGNPASLRAALDPAIAVASLGRTRVRRAVPDLLRFVHSNPPDVVLSTHTHLNLALCAIRPLLPHRSRLALREPTHAPVELDGRATRARRLAQRLLYRRADLVIATSEVMRADMGRLTGARISLLPNPVRVDAIREAARSPSTPRPTEGRRFVSVGRLDPQKSLPDLVAAFAVGSGPSDELLLIGEGPARQEVIDTAVEHGVHDRVHLLGFLAQPWAEVAASDAFLLASRAEGMPNAVLEALAVGTPVIAVDDLEALVDIRDAAPAGAVRLVHRAELSAAIRDASPIPASAFGTPRSSLLPTRFDAPSASEQLRKLLVKLA